MKNECKRIEPLLHLFREGELTDREKADALAHVDSCARCKGILESLRSLDAALSPVRENIPDLPADSRVIDRVIDEIRGESGRRIGAVRRRPPIDDWLSWLRPALSVAVLAAVAVLVAQQTRDAVMIDKLETRLRVRGNEVSEEPSMMNRMASLLGEIGSGQETQPFIFPAPNAASAGNTVQLLGRGVMKLLGRNEGLLEELSRRYPGLSTVTLDDGIDERERKILDTEGKAFLKEFEQLISQGAKQP